MTFDAGTWWLAVLLLGFVTAGLVYLLKRSLFGRIDKLDESMKEISENSVKKSDYFHMNDSNTNVGGWKDSSMRKTLLGNSKTPTSPLANSLMAALPSDLRAVMKSVTKYTDNVGNATGSVVGNVTATTDYLFLLAEFEVFGSRYYANDYERNSQLQYDYYKASNSRVAYKHNATGTAVWWWLRSPNYNNNNIFLPCLHRRRQQL